MKKPVFAFLSVLIIALAFMACGGGGDGGGGVTPPAAPVITGVSPDEAKQGQEVQITGTGFGATQGTSTLTVGGVSALPTDIVSWSETEIRATVPSGASTGEVKVAVGGLQSNPGFLVLLWTNEDPVNTAISAETYDQGDPAIAPDGAGGAIISWSDARIDDTFNDIYAQRVDASGNPLWEANGVAISNAVDDQFESVIAPYGAGGAIIAWKDLRSGTDDDIYAQRVDASGAVQWTENGVLISNATGNQNYQVIAPDGVGGAVIAWHDTRSGTDLDIYAQRVDASGTPQWTANGIAISNATNNQAEPAIAPDDVGGVIIAWMDYRNSGSTGWDIYAQRVDVSGNVQWTANGVAISTATDYQSSPQIVPDGAGGAIIAWNDYRSGTDYDIYAQRVSASGNLQWTANGVAISNAPYNQGGPAIAPDGAGGAIIAWIDTRSGTDDDIYAQRVNALGAVQWTENGVAISNAVDDQFDSVIAPDGAGGAIITWNDYRSGTGGDIYAQRVDDSGNVQWTANGIAVCTASNDQSESVIAPNGSGGAIIAWQDYRSGTDFDVYAQGISASGNQ